MGEKHEQKLLKAIEDYRRIAGDSCWMRPRRRPNKIIEHLRSISRGRKDYAGRLAASRTRNRRRSRHPGHRQGLRATTPSARSLIEHIVKLPGLMEVIARGENKVSFRMRGGMQVDVRLLSPESFGAAMQYFTGSKAHNVALRQRALKMGYTLSEYSLAELEDEKPVAGKTEEEIYAKLKLDYIPPELRENLGEIDAAAEHTPARL